MFTLVVSQFHEKTIRFMGCPPCKCSAGAYQRQKVVQIYVIDQIRKLMVLQHVLNRPSRRVKQCWRGSEPVEHTIYAIVGAESEMGGIM